MILTLIFNYGGYCEKRRIMAKTKEEIKELLSSSLFVEGQKSNYISISEKGDITYIEYHCKNGAKRKLQNPEEFVQATAWKISRIRSAGNCKKCPLKKRSFQRTLCVC